MHDDGREPVWAAWESLETRRVDMDTAESLQHKKGKPEVWRLSAGPASSGVIAKRSRLEEAQREHYVYTEILAYLDVQTPEYHGFLAEADGEHAWIFLEEVSGDAYEAGQGGHAALASTWLGRLHATAGSYGKAGRLPDVGPSYYLRKLRDVADTLPAITRRSAVRGHLPLLRELDAFFTGLDSSWGTLEEACDGASPTLVHGSFNWRNMRVRQRPRGPELVVFDWGAAGWGVPARDMAKLLDPRVGGMLDVYRRHALPGSSPNVDGRLHRMVLAGRVFRAIEHVHWTTPDLGYEWVEEAMRRLSRQMDEMREATSLLGIAIRT